MKNLFDSGSRWSFWLALAVVVAALSAPSLLLAAAAILVMILEALLPVESLFLPVMGLMILLGLFFLWGDRHWWKDVKDLF